MTSHNELRNAVSPYLLQHKDNPVHWRIWGPESLADAKRSGKPILLSIGYAACHWCHVMAHESFEDEATATIMNDLFVNIKVDREERPDVDHLYMSALHALGQRGGWPLTMFLSSDAQPFWGGTYFPKESRYGRPSFVDVLRQISTIYHTNPERVQQNASALGEALASRPASSDAELTEDIFDVLTNAVASRMDTTHGGLAGAPKFPNVSLLLLLWRGGARLKRKDIQGLVLMSLQRICDGGIYDHLGGGFARYSVDEKWLVPHFEKMLYDNAQLLDLLSLAFERTRHSLFRARAEETVGWLEREMTTAEGGFCASLDADSEGVEGKFYVWTADEIEAALGITDAEFFARYYDVTPAGNWHDEHTGQSVTVLNRSQSPQANDDEEVRLAGLREKLLAARSARTRPGLDDKVLADWNGLMIGALVNAAIAFERPAWTALAERAFDHVATAMSRHDRLAHASRAGRLTYPGFALDHAAMIGAALSLFEATARGRYLELARAWAAALERHHADAATGLLFMSADDSRDLISRQAPTADEAVPNAHGVYAACLVRLAALTGDDAWRMRADRLLEAVAPAVLANPMSHASVVNAFDFRLRGASIVIAGRDRGALRQAALKVPFLDRSVVEMSDSAALPPTHPARAQAEQAGDGAAFVCVADRCSLPIRDPSEIASRVEDMLA